VILGSLDKSERRNAFEVSPETDHPDFDPGDPLAGRWIRYWPWPFGLQKKTPLTDVAAASVEGRAVALREERERVRLLYVGFTRARDHLILAARVEAKGPAVEWLDELCDADDKPLVKLPSEPGESERPVVSLRGIGGAVLEVPARHWVLGTGGDTPARLANPDSHVWFARPDVGSGERPPRSSYWIAPSRAATEWPELGVSSGVPSAGAASTEAVELLSIGERLPLGEEKDVTWDTVGDAMHAFLAADVAGLEREQRLARAHRILVAADLGSLLTAHALLRAGDQLRAWVDARWPGATWHREYPVTEAIASPDGTRRVQGTIDLLLETPDGVVLIDHKSFPGGQSQWIDKAREFAPQLAAYRHVLAAAGKRVVATYVHFPIGAGVAKL